MELDEGLRARLGRLARSDEGPALDELATARIARRVAVEAARRNASIFRGGFGVLAAGAAAVAAGIGLWLVTDQPAESPRACASWAAPRDLDPAGERLDFEGRVLAVASPGAALRVERAEACSLRLELASGRATVHARDLGGGELRVRAGALDAVVRGTLFAVERASDGAVTVEVVEGRVAGERVGEEVASAHAGQRFVARGGSIERRSLDARAAELVRAALSPVAPAVPEPVAEPTPAPSAAEPEPAAEATAPEPASAAGSAPTSVTELLSRARRAKAVQHYDDARSLYRAAGAARAADAEAAWLDLARLEIEQRRFEAARDALRERAGRFGDDSALALEAANAELRLERAAGRGAEARVVAQRIIERWPDTPYAAQARRHLSPEKEEPK